MMMVLMLMLGRIRIVLDVGMLDQSVDWAESCYDAKVQLAGINSN